MVRHEGRKGTIEVPGQIPGIEVRRGDLRLELGSLGSRLPVDPGKYEISVNAPGYRPFSIVVTIGEKADAQTLKIPPFEKAPEAAPPPPPAPSSGRGPAPWIVGAAGLAGIGVGTAFGILALKTYSQAKDACPTRTGCSADALDLRSRANLQANVANVTIPVGVAGIGASVLLFVLTGKGGEPRPAPAAALTPVLDPRCTGLSFAGVF